MYIAETAEITIFSPDNKKSNKILAIINMTASVMPIVLKYNPKLMKVISKFSVHDNYLASGT